MTEEECKAKLLELDNSISLLKIKMKKLKSSYVRHENVLVSQKEQSRIITEQLQKIESRKINPLKM